MACSPSSSSHPAAPKHWRKVFDGNDEGWTRPDCDVYLPKSPSIDDNSAAIAAVFSFNETLAAFDAAPLVLFSAAEENQHPELIDPGD